MIKAEWTNSDALNLQPTCNQLATDCVSRKMAIDELDKGAWGVEWDKTLAKTMIESLPTAERKGHYIRAQYDEWVCSECGCVFEDEEPTYKYCPNCGADMRGEKSE